MSAAGKRDYSIQVFRNATQVPSHCRETVIATLNAIIASNWRVTSPWWSNSSTPFHDDYGIALAQHESRSIGFSIWRRLSHEGRPVLYRSGTEIIPQYQGQGIFWLFLEAVLAAEKASIGAMDNVYYCWRTRNPIIWGAHAKICRTVVPSLLGGEEEPALEAAGISLAALLYPGHAVETPSMVMRNAYPNITHYTQPSHSRISKLNDVFAQIVPNTADAIFSVGLIDAKALPASLDA